MESLRQSNLEIGEEQARQTLLKAIVHYQELLEKNRRSWDLKPGDRINGRPATEQEIEERNGANSKQAQEEIGAVNEALKVLGIAT